jgi:glycosyltransferase involved in cell wall biosynthesis
MTRRPTLHLLGIFHTQHTDEFSHCAFTGKATRFPRMMRAEGWDVVVYANEGSGEDETILSKTEFDQFFRARKGEEFHGDYAVIGSPAHMVFEERLIKALTARCLPNDIICHPFGHVHERVVRNMPGCFHVETGIGYPTVVEGSFKIFESYAWMHSHQGKAGRNGINYEWVVPNYFDVEEWEPSYEPGEYIAFLGRICQIKGMDTVKEIAERVAYPVILHGQGDPEPWKHPNIEYRGPITGKARSDFLRNARGIIMPSVFTEPFAGAGVEAMLCGTPLISVDYGAFTETVIDGVTGFRCHTLKDWIDAVNNAHTLDRRFIADRARKLYSLEACGKKYTRIFEDIAKLSGAGWYDLS